MLKVLENTREVLVEVVVEVVESKRDLPIGQTAIIRGIKLIPAVRKLKDSSSTIEILEVLE